MLNTEFVKNLHNNYERIMLEKKPEERRYQYCILSRTNKWTGPSK